MLLENAKNNLPFQVFSSATKPANGNAMNGPKNAQNIVENIALSATELIYIVLPISNTNAERNMTIYLFIFVFLNTHYKYNKNILKVIKKPLIYF